MSQFQKYFESLNLQHQVQITEKKTQLEEEMTILQSQPQLEKFLDQEIISAYPTEKIVLQVEEVPSLDVFYSPSHKVVDKRRKRKIIDDRVTDLTNKSVDVL